MKKLILALSLILLLALGLTACGTKGADQPAQNPVQENENTETPEDEDPVPEEPEATTQIITYLGTEYEVPAKVERIVITGSMESMEDALILDVKPVGAISVGGSFPEMFAPVVTEAVSIGEKTQPDLEAIVQLKPDVILSSLKFPEETAEKLALITTTIPVSHIASDWEANLILLGQLTGKEAEAVSAIQDYKDNIAAGQEQIAPVVEGKKVIAIRIRGGNLYIYPENIFLNAVLYEDLGIAVPEPVQAATAQENISLEAFSELNPDYIFVQFSEDENADNPAALEDLQNNPIWNSITAVKNGDVFVNAVDPLAQGGTAWSKAAFLKAVVESIK